MREVVGDMRPKGDAYDESPRERRFSNGIVRDTVYNEAGGHSPSTRRQAIDEVLAATKPRRTGVVTYLQPGLVSAFGELRRGELTTEIRRIVSDAILSIDDVVST